MSEIPPDVTWERFAVAPVPVRSGGRVTLANETTPVEQRYSFLDRRDATRLVVSMGSRPASGDESVARPHRIIVSGDANCSEGYTRRLADRSALVLSSQSAELTGSIGRESDTPEPKHLHFGATVDCGLADPWRGQYAGEDDEARVHQFQPRNVTAGRCALRLPGRPGPSFAPAQPVETEKSEDRVDFTNQKAEGVAMGYSCLIASLIENPGEYKRLGCFGARIPSPTDSFVKFRKLATDGAHVLSLADKLQESAGNKIHFNVSREAVPEAWQVLQPLLLSADNPFLSWKMTVIENCERSCDDHWRWVARREIAGDPNVDADQERTYATRRTRRLVEGMQFTLYPAVISQDLHYGISGPQFRHFLNCVDRTLAENGVEPGRMPDSDVTIPGLVYSTYRHGACGTRGTDLREEPITEETLKSLRETPFYRAITNSAQNCE